MARLKSISLRLTIWFSSVFLVGLILFGVVMWFDLSFSLQAGRQRTLSRRADRLIELLQLTRNLETAEKLKKYQEFVEGTPEGQLIQVFEPSGKRVYPPFASPATFFPWPSTKLTSDSNWNHTSWNYQPFLVLVHPVQIGSQPLIIYVAGQLNDNFGLIYRFQVGLIATIPALFLLSSIGGYLISRRALKPVDRLTVSARDFSANNLSGRLPVLKTGDELERLAETCNDMLMRLEGSVNQMKRFTADASHELRSPISFMRTVAECALLNPEMDNESQQYFKEIVHEAAQAGQLLDDMLALARADTGDGNLELIEVDACEILRESCHKIEALAKTQHQIVSLELPESGCAPIAADPSSLRRLFWILLDNAVKYTPEKGHILVQIENRAEGVKIFVRDSGIGIPLAELPHIFDRFYRVDPSRSQVSGTGLGLAIAKWIAGKHHATLTVTSEEQMGSTFQLVFPSV